MKAFIYRTSDSDFNAKNVRDFNSLEELLEFQKETGEYIIIKELDYWLNEWKGEKPDFEIEIYDDYRE